MLVISLCIERLIYINIYGLGLGLESQVLGLGLTSSGLGLGVAGLVNFTAFESVTREYYSHL
jgi:hypothetical protein